MNKPYISFLTTLFLLIFAIPAIAQFERVEFDYVNAYFNNGQPLPAEQSLLISSEVPSEVALVEMSIFKAGANMDKAPLFMGAWKRTRDEGSSSFRIPVSYKLTGSTEYDFEFVFYRGVTPDEKATLQSDLLGAIDAYLEQNVEISQDKVKLSQSARSIVSDLNSLVNDGLQYYRTLNGMEFQGFSDLSEQAISQLDKLSIPNSQFESSLERVEQLLETELEQIFNTRMVVRIDERLVMGYETERTRRPIALNVGYGGAILDYNSESFAYDTSPYVGVSFPLANPALSGAFWSNASISVGAFTSNFEDVDGNIVTGPIFGRPYYVGLGYNVFRFIRINAGVTALENLGTSSIGGGSVSLDVDAISLKPFVGISAEVEIWAGLRDR